MTVSKPICARCGKEMPPESRFCLHCGKRVDRRSVVQGPAPVRLQRALGDQFEVLEEIGSGGFAVVYAVEDLRLYRRIAVKVIRPEFVTSDVVVARFRRDVKIIAQLKHPNIVGISFAGEGAGLVYCAMPLIVGDTLRERVKLKGALPVDKALYPVGGKLSISGQVIGSAEYMSPERRAGAKNIDARSDVYSLGVVGYQILTGQLPPGVDTPTQSVSDSAPREAPDLRRVRPEIPAEFATAVQRCMLRSPEFRWPSALAAAKAAGAVVD